MASVRQVKGCKYGPPKDKYWVFVSTKAQLSRDGFLKVVPDFIKVSGFWVDRPGLLKGFSLKCQLKLLALWVGVNSERF